jgi:hypothetical protein
MYEFAFVREADGMKREYATARSYRPLLVSGQV